MLTTIKNFIFSRYESSIHRNDRKQKEGGSGPDQPHEGWILSKAHRYRVHAPIGLRIRAQTPEEIALSIAAEVVKLRREGEAAIPKQN